jgi:hypothetical protein
MRSISYNEEFITEFGKVSKFRYGNSSPQWVYHSIDEKVYFGDTFIKDGHEWRYEGEDKFTDLGEASMREAQDKIKDAIELLEGNESILYMFDYWAGEEDPEQDHYVIMQNPIRVIKINHDITDALNDMGALSGDMFTTNGLKPTKNPRVLIDLANEVLDNSDS